MFVYEYVSAGFDEIITALDDEDFDPHKHRNIAHPTTYSETMTHMLKGCLGCGMLAMPNAVARVGLIVAPLGIAGIGLFAVYCIQVLVLAQYALCKKLRRGYMAYTMSMRYALEMGPPLLRPTSRFFAGLVDFFLIFWQIGICAIYFVFVAENLKQLLDFYLKTETSVRMVITYLFPVELALCMVKNLKIMTPISQIANVFIVIGLLFTFFYLIEDDVEVTSESFQIQGLLEIPVFIGITLFALEAVGVILALEYSMENPREFTGCCGLFSIGMAIILSVYVILGVAGFLKYGRKCEGSLTLNLPQNEKRAQTVKFSFIVALFLSFPLQSYVAWQICWRLIGKKFENDWKADYVLRVVLVIVPYVMAVIAPNLGAFMGLMGALCLSTVAIFFPALMDICVFYPNEYGPFNYKLFSDIFIMIFGSICCCSGVYTSLLEMYEEYSTS